MAACTLGDLSFPHAHAKRARRAFAATRRRRATMRNHQGQGQPVPCQEILVPPGFLSLPLFRGTRRISVDYRTGQSGAGARKEAGRRGEGRGRIKKERREGKGQVEKRGRATESR